MKIYEVMNNAVEYKWNYVGADGGAADFAIGEYTYMAEISEVLDNIYSIEFALNSVDGKINRDNRHGIADTGNQFLVFGTVKEVLLDFLKNHANKETLGVFFSAKEPSRQRLYSRFLKHAHKIGFPATMEEDGSSERNYIMAFDEMGLQEIRQQIED